MPNFILSTIIALLSFQFFTITYRVNGINRTMFNIPISIFESSIPLAQELEKPNIYFKKNQLEEKLTSYFDKSISKYCNNYMMVLYFYNQEDYSYCTAKDCKAVEVTLRAEIMVTFYYTKTARFYIQDNR